jgi:hypothetical protein
MENLLNVPYIKFILTVVLLIYVFAEIVKSILKALKIPHRYGILFSVGSCFIFFIGWGNGIIAEMGILNYSDAAIPGVVRAIDILWTATICGVGSMLIDIVLDLIKRLLNLKSYINEIVGAVSKATDKINTGGGT